jgi:hypothetical protein
MKTRVEKRVQPKPAPNIGSQVPLSLHPNFPTLSLRKTSGVPSAVGQHIPPHKNKKRAALRKGIKVKGTE